MAIVVKKNTKYASANWQVELYTGETKLDADVLGLNITLKKGSISNPFSEVMANSCTLRTSYILIKGQQVSIHFVYDDEDVEVFNGYVEDADYDGEVSGYTLYSEDTRYNVLCPTLDWSDYPSYDGTYKKSVTLNWIIEQGCTKLGLPVPGYMPYDFECSTDSAFIEYQKYTMAQLISFYNASCAITGYDASFSSRLSPILLVENCMDGGFSSKFSYDGIRNAYIKQKAVVKTTEMRSDEENGISEHEVETTTTEDCHIVLKLVDGEVLVTTYSVEPTEIDDNYIKIENPIPYGNSTYLQGVYIEKLEEFYKGNSTSNFHQFLQDYASNDLSEKSVETFFTPDMVNILGKVIAVVDYDNENYLNGDNYIIDDDGTDEFYNSFYMKFPVLQIDIDYDGGVSCKLSTGGGMASGASTTNTATSDMVTIVGNSNSTTTVAESLAKLQNQISDLLANSVSVKNFDEYLANVDYLTLQSAFISSIQAETITTDYLKASEAHLDWAEILKATIDNAMIKDASIDNAKIQDATIEYAKVSEAFIDELTTDSIFVEKLEASLANIDILTANSAIIKNLQAETAKISGLETEVAKIEDLEAEVAKISDLEAEVAKIEYLEADVAKITVLESDVASINTLMFGSATGDVIQTEFSNSVIAQLGDAQIKSAMIESISASKITSGSIYTNVVHIYGDDTNKLSIVDNTISISDGIRTRVQIGKDASSDYNMYVWDTNGNLMFDALGLTEQGVNRQIIRDDMVKDNANISAEKLNIDTLFSVINNDASRTLKSSKIYVDADGQTLDISFKTLTSSVTTATETATNATSTAQQAYDMAEFANGTADSAYDLAEDASTTAESANETAKSNASKITTLTTTVTSQGTDISAIQGQISSKVWQQDITTAVEVAIDELEVGGTNLLVNSNFYNGTSDWTEQNEPLTIVSIVSDDTFGQKAVIATSATATGIYQKTSNLVTGEKYTFSCYAKTAEDETHKIGIALNGDYLTQAQYFTLSDEWTRISGTFTNDGTNMNFRIYSAEGDYKFIHVANIKLERGTKATDWSPSPLDTDNKVTTLSTKYSELVQTTDSISAKVSSVESNLSSNYSTTTEMNSAIALKANEITSTVSATYTTKTEFNALEVGGTQIIRNTNSTTALVTTATWSNGGWRSASGGTGSRTVIDITDAPNANIKKGWRISRNGDTDIAQDSVPVQYGETYTMSCYARWVSGTPGLHFQAWKSSSEVHDYIKQLSSTDTTWQKYSMTFTHDFANNKDNLNIYFGVKTYDGTVEICGMKLEKGSKATDWSPAPEDVDTKIESNYSELKQTTDSITASVAAVKTDLSTNYSTTTEMNSAIEAKATSITSTVSATYKPQVVHSCSSSSGTNGWFWVARIVVKEQYANKTIKMTVSNRGMVESTCYIRFTNSSGVDPDLEFFANTGNILFYIYKSTTSTWDLYVRKSEAYDYLSIGDFSTGAYGYKYTWTWKDATITSAISGWTAATQLAGLYEVDFSSGGSNNSSKIPTSAALYSTTTIATQTAEKFQWVVKSGTSSSDFTITDRMATLTANYINLNGLVTFNGLNSELQKKVSSAYSWTSGYGSSVEKVAAMVTNWADGAVSSTTTIDGGLISTNTITAEKIALGDFTNYATVNERNSATMIPTTVFGGTTISSGYICKPTATNQFLMFNNYTPCAFRSGDVLYFRATLKRATSASLGVYMWFYDSSKVCVTTITGTTVTVGTSDKTVTASFSITATASTASYFVIGIADGASTYSQIYAKNAQLIRRYTGELLVDGTITAGKIASSAITADKIAAGAILTDKIGAYAVTAGKISTSAVTADKIAAGAITATKIAAGTITADKINLTDLFSQSITASNLNITGGSVNISTSSKDNSVISLNYASSNVQYRAKTTPSAYGCLQYNGSGSLNYWSLLRPDSLSVHEYITGENNYAEVFYDGLYINGEKTYSPILVDSGCLQPGYSQSLTLKTNSLYILLLQAWRIDNAFGMYAFMCTSGSYITTIASAAYQRVELDSNVLYFENQNSNGNTYYKLLQIF